MNEKTACVDTETVPFDVARSALFRAVESVEEETVPLADAFGRVAAEDIIAQEDLVPYTRSAMDGYALQVDDTSAASADSPLGLPIGGKVFTGDGQSELEDGTVMGITTGAPIPINADAVVPSEQVAVSDGLIFLSRPVPVGDCIFPPAEDANSDDYTPRLVGRAS
jgi:molybdopterin molybdotransferase